MKLTTKLRNLFPIVSIIGIGILIVVVVKIASFERSTSDWEKTIHEEYGFSFEYPTEWRVRKYGENGYRNDYELKAVLDLPWNDGFNVSIRVVQTTNPTLEKAIQWGEQRITYISKLQESRGNEPERELFLKEEELNGQVIARRRYQGNEILSEDVYIVRTDDLIVITLESPESSFEFYTDEFERVIASFTRVN